MAVSLCWIVFLIGLGVSYAVDGPPSMSMGVTRDSDIATTMVFGVMTITALFEVLVPSRPKCWLPLASGTCFAVPCIACVESTACLVEVQTFTVVLVCWQVWPAVSGSAAC